jgi:hypothetical protein
MASYGCGFDPGDGLMSDETPVSPDRSRLLRAALSRWENEGGAGAEHPRSGSVSNDGEVDTPPLANAELVQLRVRVIALENAVIALLAEAPDWQLDLVREMAAYISPRHGFTPHPLTIHAAAEMLSLVERAGHFRGLPRASGPQIPSGTSWSTSKE